MVVPLDDDHVELTWTDAEAPELLLVGSSPGSFFIDFNVSYINVTEAQRGFSYLFAASNGTQRVLVIVLGPLDEVVSVLSDSSSVSVDGRLVWLGDSALMRLADSEGKAYPLQAIQYPEVFRFGSEYLLQNSILQNRFRNVATGRFAKSGRFRFVNLVGGNSVVVTVGSGMPGPLPDTPAFADYFLTSPSLISCNCNFA